MEPGAMTLVYVLVLLLAGNVVSLEFNSCGESEVPPNYLSFFHCRHLPCQFTLGSNVTGVMNIMVGEESTDLIGEMTVDHNGSKITFPVPGVHICVGLEKDKCRFKSGDSANYYFKFQVNVDLPDEDIATFRMVVRNENGTSLSCAEFNGTIVGDAITESKGEN
ncbi:uncharacterized protein [Hetaerina americana]|uniref:uncharacterized protein n=1 Tax=Hetaerina americana TaxID=62018 RepID=UPI003A7F54BF